MLGYCWVKILLNFTSTIPCIVRAVKVLVAFSKASFKSILAAADPVVTKCLKSWSVYPDPLLRSKYTWEKFSLSWLLVLRIIFYSKFSRCMIIVSRLCCFEIQVQPNMDQDQFLDLYLVRRAHIWVTPMQKILFCLY